MSWLLFFWVNFGLAQTQNLSPDMLSAKTLLEDMIIRSYEKELTTYVAPEHFSLAARLEIAQRAKSPKQKEEVKDKVKPLTDLEMGFLDPEKLF